MSNEQGELGLNVSAEKAGLVECLGMTFEDDEARRTYFTERLREKLQNPDFRKTPGFPRGSDEAILRISDPPYYTACPNPFLRDFATQAKPDTSIQKRRNSPFSADVSGSKKDALYTAHTYHTKVPPAVIAACVLHYTQPDDVVLDPFCGSGMTGVGVRLCESPNEEVRSALDSAGSTYTEGRRRAILLDLSPAATAIARGHSLQASRSALDEDWRKALDKLGDLRRELYFTDREGKLHEVKYFVLSDMFGCPSCATEFSYWDAAVDPVALVMRKPPRCPTCDAELSKRDLEQLGFSRSLSGGKTEVVAKEALVAVGIVGQKGLVRPNERDVRLYDRILGEPVPTDLIYPMMFVQGDASWGDQWRRGNHRFVSSPHHFFSARNYKALCALWSEMRDKPALRFAYTSAVSRASRRWAVLPNKLGVGNVAMGTLYIPSIRYEMNPFRLIETKLKSAKRYFGYFGGGEAAVSVAISTQSSCHTSSLPANSIDYVFTDPPFGDNLAYSELNFLWEAWFGVFSHREDDAIVSKRWGKSLGAYLEMMRGAFREAYRVLRPGRWMTLVFHNSKNAVWNAIQEALFSAGFVVADVRTLDKTQGSYNQIVAAGSVKHDLMISAYKPVDELEERVSVEDGGESVWLFVRRHLEMVPMPSAKNGDMVPVAERANYLLFDRMVAYFVQRSFTVPMSAAEFYGGLEQRFPMRDQMYFLPDQVAKYDRKRTSAATLRQLDLFVSDEASAIQWLRQQLHDKPRSFQDLQPQFMRELQAWAKHEEAVELKVILDQCLLHYDGRGPVPSQIHSYLSSNFKDMRSLDKEDPRLKDKASDRWYVPDPSKQADLDQLRDRALLKEFEEYKASTKRKLKVFRTEAVRAGFKAAWQARDYGIIVKVAEKLPSDVLQEDATLLMYYDNALTRLGDE